MHPVARVFQILFLLGGLAMFAYALDESGKGQQNLANFRFECKTVNTGTTERPVPKETCESNSASIYDKAHDEALTIALAGVGLMIGAAAISIGSRRAPRADSPLPAPQQYNGGGQFPAQPNQTPPQNY